MIEDEEEAITDDNNVTAYAFSHASSSNRENSNTIFTTDKLEKLDELVDAIDNLTINDARSELNIATMTDKQGNIMSESYTVTIIRNRLLDQEL